jgi:hypothetical protein
MIGWLNNSFKDVRHVAENVSIIFPKNVLAATDKELHDGAKSSINKYENNTVTCIPFARQRLGKHIPAKGTHATIRRPLLGNGQVNAPH